MMAEQYADQDCEAGPLRAYGVGRMSIEIAEFELKVMFVFKS